LYKSLNRSPEIPQESPGSAAPMERKRLYNAPEFQYFDEFL
jgi:hypothetical protein